MLKLKTCFDHKPKLIYVKRKEKKRKEVFSTQDFSSKNFPTANSLFKQKRSLYRQLASSVATFYTKFTKNQAKVINLIISMISRYQPQDIVPSQGWIAKQIGCDLRTVNRAFAILNKFGIISKKGRGWRVCKKDNFKSMTCEYSIGKSLSKDMEFIHTYLPRSGEHITKLLESIPALLKAFSFFVVLTSLAFNSKINIDSLRSSIFRKMGHNKGVKKDTTNATPINFHFHPKKGSKHWLLYNKTYLDFVRNPQNWEEVGGNSNYADDYMELYEKHNINQLFAAEHSKKRRLQYAGIDIRNCPNETEFERIPDEYKDIASRYYEGRKKYGSVEKYEAYLRRENIMKNMWRPACSTMKLTPEQIKTIKSFPDVVIQEIKKELQLLPDKKEDFDWIYEQCISRCKMKNLPITNLLKKHEYTHSARRSTDSTRTNGMIPKGTYIPEPPRKYNQVDAEKEIQKVLDNFEHSKKIMGEEIAAKLHKKLIDNIINNIN